MTKSSKDYFMKIQRRARAIGWSLSELCRRSGVSRATLSLWRLGGTNPTVGTIQKLEVVLDKMERAVQAIDFEDAQRGMETSEAEQRKSEGPQSSSRASRASA